MFKIQVHIIIFCSVICFNMYSPTEFFEVAFVNVALPFILMGLFLILVNVCNSYGSRALNMRFRGAKKHSWMVVKENDRSFRCNICEMLLISVEIFYCDSCGVCADSPCLKIADNKFKCKETSVESEGPMKHRYVKGNLPMGSECEVCEEECTDDLRCIWCLRTVHNTCQQMLGDVCDFGKFKKFILPPNNVIITKKRSRVGAPVKLFHISEPPWKQSWTPLFVLANRKSGNMIGGSVLSEFRTLLNAYQVIDLSEKNPSVIGDWLSVLPEAAKPIILVAGGDGTVAWVLSALKKFTLKRIPPVCVIPLGTGNDLSRVLGWGKQEPQPFLPKKILESISEANAVNLDRWIVNVKNRSRLSRQKTEYLMYNYLSIGVDALVTLDFHNTRQSPFYIFSNRIINKLLYLIFGTQQVMERQCKGLEQRIELYLDGHLVNLPELESIVVLNIPCWGAGVYLWSLGLENDEEIGKQSMNDGKLEVVAISSSFHIAQLQVGLSQPHRLGQASDVKIIVKKRTPIQIDGEPWMQQPCDIHIKWDSQAVMLKNSTTSESNSGDRGHNINSAILQDNHPLGTL